MSLPNLDLELTYYRARRRFYRLRQALRFHVSDARAKAHLHYLCLFGRMPEKPAPEETRLFQALWIFVLLGLAGVIAIESTVGEERFLTSVSETYAAVTNLPERRSSLVFETARSESVVWLGKQ